MLYILFAKVNALSGISVKINETLIFLMGGGVCYDQILQFCVYHPVWHVILFYQCHMYFIPH
jgi:hypothetical protein